MKSKNSAVPKYLITGLKIAQVLSPRLAKKMALKLFFTPFSFPTPEDEFFYKRELPIHRDLIHGKRITTYLGGSSPFTVLLVHGWSGRASQFMHIAKELKTAKINHISFTAPAHGSPEIKRTHMLEIAECIEYLDRIYGPFKTIIGHSMGGVASLNAIKNKPLKTEKIVMIGVPATVKETIGDFCKKVGLSDKILNFLIDYLKKHYHRDYEKYSALRLAGEIDIKALVVHDKRDGQVAFNHGERINAAFKNSELFATEGSGHTRILSDKKVVEKIMAFVKS